MPKVSEQYRDERREQILQAARRCFLANGFHATSMQDLFAEAGLSSGAVYRYFASKDEMILAIAGDSMREVIGLLSTVADAGGSIGEALAAAIDLVQTKDEHDGLAGLGVQAWSEALRNPALEEQFRTTLTQARGQVAEVVRQHQAAGGLPAGPPPNALASVLISIVPGYILQRALLGADAVSGTADALRALWPE